MKIQNAAEEKHKHNPSDCDVSALLCNLYFLASLHPPLPSQYNIDQSSLFYDEITPSTPELEGYQPTNHCCGLTWGNVSTQNSVRITEDDWGEVMIVLAGDDLRCDAGWHYPVLDGCYYCNFAPTSTQVVASQPTSAQLN